MKKLIVFLLITQIVFGSFSRVLATPALPPPPQGWSEHYNATTKQMEIVFKSSGSADAMHFQLETPFGYSEAIDSSSLPIVRAWKYLNGGGTQYFVFTNGGSTGRDGFAVENLCTSHQADTTTGVTLDTIKIVFDSVSIWLNGTVQDKFECYDIKNTNDLLAVQDIAQAGAVGLLLTQGFAASARRIQLYTRPGGAPLADNITGCASFHTAPIYSDPVKIKAFFDKIKTEIDSNTANAGVITKLDGYLATMQADSGVIAQLQRDDGDIYKMFYSSDPSLKYPNVMLDNSKKQELLKIVNNEELYRVIDDRQVSGITGASTPTTVILAAVANLLTWGIRITANTAIDRITEPQFRQSMEAYAKLTMALTYVKANQDFNQCLAGKGDPYAYVNPAIVSMVEQLWHAESDIGAGMEPGQSACDKISGSGYIANMIGQAFCGLVLNIKQWADTLYCWSLGLFQSAVGVSTNKSVNATVPQANNICTGTTDTKRGVDSLNSAQPQ